MKASDETASVLADLNEAMAGARSAGRLSNSAMARRVDRLLQSAAPSHTGYMEHTIILSLLGHDGWVRLSGYGHLPSRCEMDCPDRSVEVEWWDEVEVRYIQQLPASFFDLDPFNWMLESPHCGTVADTPNNADVLFDPPDGVLQNYDQWEET